MVGELEGGVSAFVDRPSIPTLVLAVLTVVAGWGWHVWVERSTRPAELTIEPDRADIRPSPLDGDLQETPAVVALLTNGFRVPSTAITATTLDLAARGWIRIGVVDDELVVVTRGQGAEGDTVLPYEQQVLNHLASRAFNDVTSAGTLIISQHRLDRRWRNRFARAVAAHAEALGLTARRFRPEHLAPGMAATGLAAILLSFSLTRGTDADLAASWRPRAIALAVTVATVALGWATYVRAAGADQRPTDPGRTRAEAWLAYRRRLRDRIPNEASVLATPAQQQALAVACVMGVAEHVQTQLPVAPEEPRSAWSEAGQRARLVRVRYPIRPGYGQHPIKVAVAGLAMLLIGRWLQGFLERVADHTALASLLDKMPGQVDLLESLATLLAVLCWIPIAWGAWSLLAGVVDSVATRERIGLVVRAKRPADVLPYPAIVNPLADRNRFSMFLAVDDGRAGTVTAWLASERTGAPQGAQARVRATPLLGFVRSSEPVGTATRGD